MSEKSYENKLKAHLKANGAYFVKYFGCAFTQSGVPDILACVGGRFVAIEVKDTKGRPSPLQLANLRSIDRAGGVALLAYPKDFEFVKSIICALNDNKPINQLYKPFLDRLQKF